MPITKSAGDFAKTGEANSEAALEADALIGARIERLPTSSWHRLALLLIGTATFFDAYDISLIAYVMPILKEDWNLSLGQVGLVFSAGFAGLAIGAPVFGWLAERYGRVPILIVTVLLMSLCGIGCALSTNYTALLFFRFLQGVALGGELPVAVSYVTELTKPARRGQIIAAYQFTAGLGFLAASMGSYLIIPRLGWEAMFWIGAIPALLTLLMRAYVLESPRWLARRGRAAEADKILCKIEQKIVAKHGELPPVVVKPVIAPPPATTSWQLLEIFSPLYWKRTVALWTIWIVSSTLSYGLLTWLPIIFRNVYKMPMEEVLRYSAIGNAVALAATATSIFLVERIGRRNIFLFSFTVASFAMLSLWYFGLYNPIFWVLMLMAILGRSAIGMGQIVVWGYTSESYPTRVRSFATGVASVWGRLATVATPPVVSMLLTASSSETMYLVFGLIAAAGVVIVLTFAVETRGRSLEEVSP